MSTGLLVGANNDTAGPAATIMAVTQHRLSWICRATCLPTLQLELPL